MKEPGMDRWARICGYEKMPLVGYDREVFVYINEFRRGYQGLKMSQYSVYNNQEIALIGFEDGKTERTLRELEMESLEPDE